ncbi:hypothetical protein V6N11_003565 [Hibiscus sabdariffa]|uniref:Uncharacterized protein n=1 Tax=Hibiscus sabdariffa TaxID=183260 RepID=A0ABR2SEI5_9ROSI
MRPSGLSFIRECRFFLCKLPLFKIRLVTEKIQSNLAFSLEFSDIKCSLKLLLRPNISTVTMKKFGDQFVAK